MNTFKKLYTDVLRYFDLALETEGSDVELAKAAVNTAHQLRCNEDNWKFMLSPKYSLEVEADQQDYILPHEDFKKFQYLWSVTKKRFCRSIPMRQIPSSNIELDYSQGDTQVYTIDSMSPVVVQPAATGERIRLTSGAAEPASPYLVVEGETSDGTAVSEELSKDSVSYTEFAKITGYYKVGDFEGTIILIGNTSGTVFLSLRPTEYAKQYPVLRFITIPTESETLSYRYFRNPKVLEYDYQIPNIPFPESGIVVYDALLDLATYNEIDSESVNIWRAKQEQFLQNLYLEKLDGDSVAGLPREIVSEGY